MDDYTLSSYEGCSFNCQYCYIRGSKYGENMSESLSVKINALEILWGLAQNYIHLMQYEQAGEFLLKSIAVGKSIDALQELRKIYLLGSDISEKTDAFAAALDYRKRYEILNDSLIGAETQQNIHRIEIEYQTSQKERDLFEISGYQNYCADKP
ncbi:MAG: hypothetical protein ABIR06_16685 [Cyclobacteriaceae bacterium]